MAAHGAPSLRERSGGRASTWAFARTSCKHLLPAAVRRALAARRPSCASHSRPCRSPRTARCPPHVSGLLPRTCHALCRRAARAATNTLPCLTPPTGCRTAAASPVAARLRHTEAGASIRPGYHCRHGRWTALPRRYRSAVLSAPPAPLYRRVGREDELRWLVARREEAVASPTAKEQILSDLDQLSPDQQRRAAVLVHALVAPQPRGPSIEDLLSIAGTLNDRAARHMMQAIEEGCERVGLDEW